MMSLAAILPSGTPNRLCDWDAVHNMVPVQLAIRRAFFFSDLSEIDVPPFVFDKSAKSSVSGLLFVGRPSAVFFAVGLEIINAIKRVIARWARSHVPEKLSKIAAPFFAYGRTDGTVPRIADILFVVAPPSHMAPRFVFDGKNPAPCVAMCRFEREKWSANDKRGSSASSHSTTSNRVAVRARRAVRKPSRPPIFLAQHPSQLQAALDACRGAP